MLQAPAPPAGLGKGARLRLFGAAAALALFLLMLVPGLVGQVSRVAWIVANVGLFLFLAGWALLHPRSVGPAFGVARTWAFWVGLLITLLGSSYMETFLGEGLGFKIPGGLMLFAAFVFFLFLTPLLLVDGFVGAAAGVLWGPGRDTPTRARTGAGIWWLVNLPLLFLSSWISERPGWEGLATAIMMGGTGLTFLSCRELERYDLEPRRVAHALLAFLSRHLIRRRVRAGRREDVDLRGPALGLFAALLAIIIGLTQALVPLQAVSVVSLIRLRNEPLMGGMSIYRLQRQNDGRDRQHIVLLTLDSGTRRQALTTGSEAAVQAEMLRKLREWDPALVVLPAPLLDRDDFDLRTVEAPLPRQADIERTEKDLEALRSLVASWTKVVVGVPSGAEAFMREEWRGVVEDGGDRTDPDVERFAAAARHSGQSGVAFLGAARLPAIPTRWHGPAPLPLVVAAAAAGHPLRLEPVRGQRAVRFGSRVFPMIAAERLLVDFAAPAPGQEFPTLTYDAVRRGDPIYDRTHSMPAMMQDAAAGEWVEPKQFFQGKIVFLDAIAEPLQDTPIGLMPQNEVLAHATATLLSEATVRSPAPFWSFLWPAALGLWVGHLCGRRRPIEGTWRVAGVVFLVALVTTAAFLLSATWIDPVVPTLAALGAFVLATQFTFELERGERERNRALLQRFVAPQLVDEMLDDPDFELGLGGRRRQVCVVFADVRNFTGFAEANTPEHVIEVTNRYLSAMTDALHHYGGILDKYTGDGLMAFFEEGGAGQEREPLPLMARAVQACIAMQQSTAAVSAELHRQGLPPLHVGIGLHYGEAVVGFVGNPNRLDYTALGHTVVVSQRLQSIAAGGEVIISETVFRAVSGMFPVVAGEPVQVKGLAEPMTPYRVGTLSPDSGAYPGPRQDL